MDTLIAHNTCYGSTGPLLQIDADEHRGSVVANNIFVQEPNRQMTAVMGKTTGLTFQSNLWCGQQPQPLARSAADVFDDPELQDAAGFDPLSFRLRPSSPAIGATIFKTIVAVDFSGQRRARESIGAW
ncbi:MAG: hypothetical protein R3C05_03940 [Pirellulaceae bacterium]